MRSACSRRARSQRCASDVARGGDQGEGRRAVAGGVFGWRGVAGRPPQRGRVFSVTLLLVGWVCHHVVARGALFFFLLSARQTVSMGGGCLCL